MHAVFVFVELPILFHVAYDSTCVCVPRPVPHVARKVCCKCGICVDCVGQLSVVSLYVCTVCALCHGGHNRL